MLIVKRYREKLRPDGMREIYNLDRPRCPDCGGELSGYDRRRRVVLDDRGGASVYLLRRLSCRRCGRLHLEIPDIMQPCKHYAAELIAGTLAGTVKHCPADNSTIRRWKKGGGV